MLKSIYYFKIFQTILKSMKFTKKEREQIYDFMNEILEKKLSRESKKEQQKETGE